MNYLVFLFILLASVGFFNYHGILSPQMLKLVLYLAVTCGLGYTMVDGAPTQRVKYPRVAYIVVLASIAISDIMASAFHSQSLVVSVVTSLPYLFSYACLYIFFKLDVPIERVMKTMMVLCGVSCFVYFCNVLTFPANIFGEPILNEDTSRGIIRIPVVFIELFPMMVFYAINRWLVTKERKWIAVGSVAFMMIILSVIRQVILVTFVLGIYYLFKHISRKARIVLTACMIGTIVVILPLVPMFNAMIELTESQREENEEDENIRIKAWRYYSYENQTNALTPFFGNGVPSFGNSRWGQIFDSETQENGCFSADIGFIGFFWHFGIFGTVALLMLLWHAMRRRKAMEYTFLTYWIVYLFCTGLTSAPYLYYYQTVEVMLGLYMAYKAPAPQSLAIKEEDEAPTSSPSLFRKYPQLNP